MDDSRKTRVVVGRTGGNVHEILHIEHIMATIFTKLPVNSLLFCKQALKQWYELINKPQFTRLHFNSNLENKKLILYLKPSNARSLDLHLMDKDAQIKPYTALQGLRNQVDIDIVSCFNGLMCCSWTTFSSDKMFVINPATHRILRIPNGSATMMDATLGVVFDVEPAKYKIVRFYSVKSLHPGAKCHNCEIYCPERESWSQVGSDLPCPIRSDPYNLLPPHLCVGGRMYWFVWRKPQMQVDYILSISMDESIKTVGLPAIGDYSFDALTFLISYKGGLGIFFLDEDIGLAGIYSLVDPETSEWKLVSFLSFETNGSLVGINSIVEIGNELLFVLQLNWDGHFHFRFLNLDTMMWREAEPWFSGRRYFRRQPLLRKHCETSVFPFQESFFKCRGE